MNLENFKKKDSVTIVYTGEGKGKTSAALGLLVRALGNDFKVAFIQFIKYWGVSEHIFLRDISEIYQDNLFFYKGGKGFFNAKGLSAPNITKRQHQEAAHETFKVALQAVSSGEYNLVICDEINNAVHDKLLTKADLQKLLSARDKHTSLCLTGRNFPEDLYPKIDIITNMTKVKHHFDNNFIANKGIDF